MWKHVQGIPFITHSIGITEIVIGIWNRLNDIKCEDCQILVKSILVCLMFNNTDFFHSCFLRKSCLFMKISECRNYINNALLYR